MPVIRRRPSVRFSINVVTSAASPRPSCRRFVAVVAPRRYPERSGLNSRLLVAGSANRVAVPAQLHGYGEGVLSGGKMIAQDPVHGRQHRFPFRRSLRFSAHFEKRSDHGVHAVTDELRDAAHRRVSRAHHAS
jgi:hypothetical protein